MQALSFERIQELLAERQAEAEKRARIDAELQAQRDAANQAAKARYQAARLNEIHTAQKEYVCECCGKAIAKGTEYRRANIPTGYGHFEGTHFQQRITHLVCAITGGNKEC